MYTQDQTISILKEKLDAQLPRLKSEGFGGSGYAWATLRCENGFLLFDGDKGTRLTMEELKEQAPLAHASFCANAELDTVLFTRPEYCCALSKKIGSLPPVLDDMAQIVGPRAFVADASDCPAVKRRMKHGFALILREKCGAPSGALTAGRNMEQAFTAALVLEKSARVFSLADKLGGAKPLGALESALMHLVYTKKYSRRAESRHLTAADYSRAICEKEASLRELMLFTCDMLTRENLVQGTWGNLSVRLDDRYMLVTPSGMEYATLTPLDIVRVDFYTLEYEGTLKPTTEKGLHAAIYRDHPELNCVVHAHPPYSSVYAAAHTEIPCNELMKQLCMDGSFIYDEHLVTPAAKYALPGTKALVKNAADAIKKNRCCVMENHGILVCGESLSDAEAYTRSVERLAKDHLAGGCETN